jgi:rod shape determining protein RodA
MGMEGIFGEGVDRIGGEPIAARMARKAPIRHLDPTLLLVTMLLTAFGAVMILSVTSGSLEQEGLDTGLYLKRQITFGVAGAVILLLVSFFDYRILRGLAPFLYGATVLALIVVLSPLGDESLGAQRWISFGAFQAQPSELTKMVLIVAVGAFLAERREEITARDVGIVIGLMLVPSALIYLEPDLGTMMVVVALTGALLLVGGAKLRHFLVLGAIGAILIASFLQFGLLRQYQLDRLTAFLDPNPDVQSIGYNLLQSKIAIGSGGISGQGLEQRLTQTSLDFVPEQHTDFIFTAVGEQLGFIGSASLLALFAFLIWRALRIAAMSRDMFGTLLATGIAALWAFQIFVNVGMTMGIMPITGIPLPFMSYGGSSLITNYVAVGLLLNVHMRRYL